MASRREILLLVALFVGSVLLGASDAFLSAAPALLLFVPLLRGRYVGEARLAALAASVRTRRQRGRRVPAQAARPTRVIVAVRGGRLLALALAERGPPAALAAR